MNRRDYLKSLLAIGAGITLPFNLATASDAEVDAAWEQGIDLFEVNGYGTISVANFAEPQTRAEAFRISVDDLDDPVELINFAQGTSLEWRFAAAYASHYGELQRVIETAESSAVRRRLKKHLAKLPEDPEEGWMDWLESEPKIAEPKLRVALEEYFNEPPDWGNEYDWIDDQASAQGAAYQYFMREDHDLLEQLGVVVIEGDHPGSSYFAAELRVPIEEANALAKKAGIPIRFKREA